jgi:hypothetical protein
MRGTRAGSLRFWRFKAETSDWPEFLVIIPAHLSLLFLPVSSPLLAVISEAVSLARLLSILDKLQQDSPEATTSDSAGQDGLPGKRFDEFDVDQRIHLRSRAAQSRRISARRFTRYVISSLRSRLFLPRPMAANFTPPPPNSVSIHFNDSPEESLLPIPLAQTRTVEKLGGVTFLSVVDDELICETTYPEEIFLLNCKEEHEAASTVLGIMYDPSVSRLKFEDTNWWRYMPSLKPLGFTCLSTESNPILSPPPEPPSPTAEVAGSRATDTALALPEDVLVRYVTQPTSRRNLMGLGREIGFCDEDLSLFVEKCRIHITAPHLVDEMVMEDTHALSQEESQMRGMLQPHVTSVVLEDTRNNCLQLLSQGNAALALPMCFDYWDGRVITTLTAEDRRLILDTHQQWTLEDFDVVAFTYAPVPLFMNRIFSNRTLPMYMVDNWTEAQQVAHVTAIREQANKERAARLGQVEDVVPSAGDTADSAGVPDPTSSAISGAEAGAATALSMEKSHPTHGEEVPGLPGLRGKSSSTITFPLPGNQGEPVVPMEKLDAEDAGNPPILGPEGYHKALAGLDSADEHAFVRSTPAPMDEKASSGPTSGEVAPGFSAALSAALSVQVTRSESKGEGELQASDTADGENPERLHREPPKWVEEKLASGTQTSSSTPTAFIGRALAPSNLGSAPGQSRVDEHSSSIKRTNSFDDIYATHRHARSRTSGTDLVEEEVWEMLQNQVFLGMIASSVRPKREIPGFVEDLMAAGVRFVYFSPRNMRRTKSLAEKIGIETDWNCAISLRPLASSAPDEHRMISDYGDWDVKARLPHGIKAIREHLVRVDNVPLLVSLFTDSTPAMIDEMFTIFQEYHESVVCVGCAFRASNAPLFQRADLSISIGGLPGHPRLSFLPRSSSSGLSLCDATFNEDIISLFCSFSIRGGRAGQQRKMTISFLIDLIREGRRSLCNVYQIACLGYVVCFTTALLMVLGRMIPIPLPPTLDGLAILWILWVVIPLLGLPLLDSPADSGVLTRCPRKNVIRSVERERIFRYLILRCLPTVLGCLYVYLRTLASFLHEGADSSALPCSGPSRVHHAGWWGLLECAEMGPEWEKDLSAWEAQSRDLMLAELVLCLAFQSAGLMYRTQPPHLETPFRNGAWVIAVLVLLSLQAVHLVFRALYRGTFVDLRGVQWDVWAVVALAPWVVLGIGEAVKKQDQRILDRFHRFLRLEFDTRLGTHSPR